jgi:trans-2-enoyl-CoA reductase
MKIVQFSSLGVPHEVCDCVSVGDPPAPGPDEILVEMEASPINPADMLNISGKYANKPMLPAKAGNEGVGRVVAVGTQISSLTGGDRVMMPARENWVEQRIVPANAAIKLPQDADILQMSLLRISPPTASLLLSEMVALNEGDWIAQNAANSAVGKLLIRMAREKGVRTVNIVRRDTLVPSLQSLGADLVLVDGPELATRVRAEIGDARLALAVDAVAGDACMRIAGCLSDGGMLVNYGVLSGAPVTIDYHELVFRAITARGFWLSKELQRIGRSATVELYQHLAARLVAGELHTDIEASYSLSQAKLALEHASRPARCGKIIFTMSS